MPKYHRKIIRITAADIEESEVEVLAAVGAYPSENQCVFGWGACNPSDPCPLHPAWVQMTEAFRDEFPGEADQVPQRVATYLYQMADNQLIGFTNFNI